MSFSKPTKFAPSRSLIETVLCFASGCDGAQMRTSRSSRNGISRIWALRRVGDDPDVEGAGEHVLVDLVRLLVLEPDVHVGVRLHEALQLVGELVQPDRVHGGDPDRSGDDVRKRLETGLEVVVPRDDLLADLVEDLARRGRPDPPLGPLDELASVAGLEGADLLAHRRLGDEVLGRGDGKTPGVHEVAEHLEGLDVHLWAPVSPAEVQRS